MNNPCKTAVFVALVALLTAGPAFTQSPSDQAASATKAAAPVAYVYVQTQKGVNVYDTASNGKLTLVAGSPFATSGQMGGINGSHLISVGTNDLHSYAIESNGAVGKQASEVNTQSYSGANCGSTSFNGVSNGALLDHTGKYFYIQLFGAQYQQGNTTCAAWQTYRVASNGDLTFLGSSETENYVDGSAQKSTVPTISSNDKFGFGVTGQEYGTNVFSPFAISSDGVLGNNANFKETDPKGNPDGDWYYYPVIYPVVAADPSGHLAALMFSENGPPFGATGAWQLASYTINSKGGISSTNTYADMPAPEVAQTYGGPFLLQTSTSGKLLALAAYPGLQLFHFNGASPITTYGPVLLPNVNIDQLAWDNSNHLYALSYSAQALYVFTVTPTSTSEVAGSPFKVTGAYGAEGLIVVPKS